MHGYSVTNSFLLLLSIATALEQLIPAFHSSSFVFHADPLKWAPALLTLTAFVFLALTADLSSPSPDLTSALLLMTLFIGFTHILSDYLQENRILTDSAAFTFLLGATSITIKLTIKLSNLIFSSVIILLVLIGIWKTSKLSARKLVYLAMPPILIVMFWYGRGYLLSGAPLYPSTIGYLSMEWSVPIDLVQEEARWVYSWARQPRVHWSEVLVNWNWLNPWLLRMLTKQLATFVIPLVIFLLLSVINLALVILARTKSTEPINLRWLILLPPLAGLIFWFFTAPSPRFATGVILLLPISAIVIFLSLIKGRTTSRTTFLLIFCAVFLIGNAHFIYSLVGHRSSVRNTASNGWEGIQQGGA